MDDKIKAMMKLGYSEIDAIVFIRANGCCEYCGIDLIEERLPFDCVQFDHIIPKSKNGGEEHENMAFSCQVCNTAKHTFVPAGNNREELIESAKIHILQRREHANSFWGKVRDIFRT